MSEPSVLCLLGSLWFGLDGSVLLCPFWPELCLWSWPVSCHFWFYSLTLECKSYPMGDSEKGF